MKPAITLTPARPAALGRGLSEIAPQLRFVEVTVRQSNLPPPRKLCPFTEARHLGPRSGISFRIGHELDRPWRTDGDLSTAGAAQFLTRLARHQPSTPNHQPPQDHVIVYTGRHYGARHRVLSRKGGKLTVSHIATGDVITVHPCDTEPAA